MRLRSLRARLLAGLIALAAVCLVALAAIVYVQQRDFLLERVDEQAAGAAPLVGRALDEEGVPRPRHGRFAPPFGPGHGPPGRGGPGPGRPGDRDGRGPGPQVALPPGVYGERRDADGAKLGSVVLTYGEDAPSPPVLPDDVPVGETITVASRDGSLDYRVNAAPGPGGALTVVAIPLSGVDEQLDELLLVEGLVIGGALLLMAALGVWVVRLGLRPLERIGDTAGKIAAGERPLSARVEPAEPATEVGRLGLSLNAMLHQIERAFAERAASEERLRVFLADASHELRTPLASIRGYAELFRMGAARDGAEAEKAMSRIEQEAARMGVLVEDLLVLARLDEVRDPVREPVDLAELARDAVADARATAPDRDVALSLAGDETVVLGDEDRLRQVVGNLVRNALVHTPAGTDVEVAVARADGRVRLEVRDRGPGLPVADGSVLFERFWRAAPGRGRGAAGAGLGLAIVHGIVAAHGGAVHAETRHDGGATFAVELPAAAEARPGAAPG
jgi:two-component system OmpR family sensor kinase